MSDYELFELFVISGQKIDALWEFFVTIHIAIVGALLFLNPTRFRKIKAYPMVVLAISYASFTLINIRAKIEEYQFFLATISDLKNRTLHSLNGLKGYVFQYDPDDRIVISIVVHALSFFFIAGWLFCLEKNKNGEKS